MLLYSFRYIIAMSKYLLKYSSSEPMALLTDHIADGIFFLFDFFGKNRFSIFLYFCRYKKPIWVPGKISCCPTCFLSYFQPQRYVVFHRIPCHGKKLSATSTMTSQGAASAPAIKVTCFTVL